MKLLVPVVLTVAALSAIPAAQRVAPFTLAVVQSGGDASLLLPVARFTGTEWLQTWPAPEDMDVPVPDLSAIPRSWLGGPVPRMWNAIFTSGRRDAVRVVGTARGGACEGPVGLKVDRALPVRGLAEPGADVVSLATDGTQAFDVFSMLSAAAPDRSAIETLAAAEFLLHERLVVNEFRDEAELKKAMLEDAIRPGRAPRLEAAFAPRGEVRPRVVWFEATKRTSAIPAYGVSVSGWAVRAPDGGWRAVDAVGRVLADDSGPVPDRVPLGRLQAGGRTYWVVEALGYEGASVIVFDVDAARIEQVLETSLGGC